jgi:hypothetical protein
MHAERLARASYPDDIERLASVLLTPDGIKELRTELGRQPSTVLARSAQHSASRARRTRASL